MKNFELRMLAMYVSLDPDKYKDGADGVTLILNGMLVSGKIIPRKAYLEQSQNETLKAIHDFFNKTGEKNLDDTDLIEHQHSLESYTRLYLKNAQYVTGDKVIPFNGNNFAVININSVDAFNIGDLKISS